MTPDRARRVIPLAAAAAGVVLAHAADYSLLYPDPGQRARELSATGHGYWPLAVGVAAAAGAALLVLAVVRGAGRQRPTGLPSLARLTVLQMALFTIIELVERVSVRVSPVPFLHSPQLAVGLALQAVAAAGCILLLSRVERAAQRLAGLFRRRTPAAPRPASWLLPLDLAPVDGRRGTPAAPRGPPLLART